MMIPLATAEETEALGTKLVVDSSIPWKTLALYGEIGAGKTTLVRGVVRALGGNPDDVHSPSYVLEHHYEINGGVLLHRDAWRGDAGETCGLPSQFQRLIVEWPDKANPDLWPGPVLSVTLEHAPSGRIASVPDGVL